MEKKIIEETERIQIELYLLKKRKRKNKFKMGPYYFNKNHNFAED